MGRFLLIIVAIGAVIAGCSDDGGKVNPDQSTSPSVTSSISPTINSDVLVLKVENNVITTGEGQAVFASTTDQGEESSCTGDCLQLFTPLHERDQVTAESPLDENLISTNSSGQVMYNNHLLYVPVASSGVYPSNWRNIDINGNIA